MKTHSATLHVGAPTCRGARPAPRGEDTEFLPYKVERAISVTMAVLTSMPQACLV